MQKLPSMREIPMTSNISRWLWMVSCSFLLAGCSWFTWLPWVDAEEEDLTEPSELVKFKAEIKVDRLWKKGVGDGLGRKYLRLPPAVVADRVIAADGYGRVQAHDRFTGKRLWETTIGDTGVGFFGSLNFIDRRDRSFVSGGVGVGEALVLLGTTDGAVVALNVSDGVEVWRTELGSEVVSPPSADNDMVVAQTIDGRLVALDSESGDILWSTDNQLPILTLRGTGRPIISDDTIYAGFANGKLSAMRASNGEPIWEHRVMLPEGRSELERMVDVDTTPLVSGAAIYVGAYHGRVKSLSRRDGRARWELELSTYLDLSEGYGQIYAVDDEDVISAIDSQSGEVVWTQEDFKRRKLNSPVAFSNYIAVGDDEGYLHIIAQRDGRHLGRRKLDGDGIRSAMVLADTTLYVLGNSGSLHAVQIELK
jgi:outer membrane protein assembly factor BamB